MYKKFGLAAVLLVAARRQASRKMPARCRRCRWRLMEPPFPMTGWSPRSRPSRPIKPLQIPIRPASRLCRCAECASRQDKKPHDANLIQSEGDKGTANEASKEKAVNDLNVAIVAYKRPTRLICRSSNRISRAGEIQRGFFVSANHLSCPHERSGCKKCTQTASGERVQGGFTHRHPGSGAPVAARDGARDMSLRSVAAEAGFAPAALYGYFRGKDDLLLALAAEDLSGLARAMRGAHGLSGAASAALSLLGDTETFAAASRLCRVKAAAATRNGCSTAE